MAQLSVIEKVSILSDRASELGKLDSQEALRVAKDLTRSGQNLSADHEAELMTITSALTARLYPEDVGSITRRRRTLYKAGLIITGLVCVYLAMLTLLSIIPLNSAFGTLQFSVASSTALATDAVLELIDEQRTLLERVGSTTAADEERPIRDRLQLIRPRIERIQEQLRNELRANCFLSEQYGLPDASIPSIILGFYGLGGWLAGAPSAPAPATTLGDALDSRPGPAGPQPTQPASPVPNDGGGRAGQVQGPGATPATTPRPTGLDAAPSTAGRPSRGPLSECESSLDINQALPNLAFFNRSMQPFLSLLGGTILPLLYGLLGSAIYLVRMLANTPIGLINLGEFWIGLPLRLGLGAIAGVALGWFNIGSEVSQLTTTPFAIAFVAGFSIDILFSFLERVVNAFSNPPPSSAPAASAGGAPVSAASTPTRP